MSGTIPIQRRFRLIAVTGFHINYTYLSRFRLNLLIALAIMFLSVCLF